MKTYRELYFEGDNQTLKAFKENMLATKCYNWKIGTREISGYEYLEFTYYGNKADKAIVSIEVLDKKKWMVGNIVPTEKNHLDYQEYNAVLMQFYVNIIENYKQEGLAIKGPTSDEYDILGDISAEAKRKLEVFSSAANKSTGASHPLDHNRWCDFICQTVYDGRTMQSDTLSRYLCEELGWCEETAGELSLEYEEGVLLLDFYKRNFEAQHGKV